jgi:hypothetical protein
VGGEEEAKSMAFSMVFSVWLGTQSGKNLPLCSGYLCMSKLRTSCDPATTGCCVVRSMGGLKGVAQGGMGFACIHGKT